MNNTNIPWFMYLDNIPKIPKELLESVEDIINKNKNEMIVKHQQRLNTPILDSTYKHFQTREISPVLKQWLADNLNFHGVAQYQIVYSTNPVHKDVARLTAYLYMLDSGGDDATVSLYDADKITVLDTAKPETHRWWRLDVSKHHGNSNITRPRVALALAIFDPDEANKVLFNDLGQQNE